MIGLRKYFLLMFTVILLHPLFVAKVYPAEIRNVTITQVGNRILLEYDFEGTEPEADVQVLLSIEGKKYTSDTLHLEGDFGKVRPGIGKKVYWNVLKDFPRGFSGEIQWEVLSKGKRVEVVQGTYLLKDIQKHKPSVRFSHTTHSDKFRCQDCHHKEGKGEEAKCSSCHKNARDGRVVDLKEAFHNRCKGCHQKEKRGPVKCDECHRRELYSPGMPTPVVQDAYLLKYIQKTKPPVLFTHAPHSKNFSCQICHHKEGNGKEANCISCHKVKREGNVIDVKEAFHMSCKGCHQKERKGPTKCDGCHRK